MDSAAKQAQYCLQDAKEQCTAQEEDELNPKLLSLGLCCRKAHSQAFSTGPVTELVQHQLALG